MCARQIRSSSMTVGIQRFLSTLALSRIPASRSARHFELFISFLCWRSLALFYPSLLHLAGWLDQCLELERKKNREKGWGQHIHDRDIVMLRDFSLLYSIESRSTCCVWPDQNGHPSRNPRIVCFPVTKSNAHSAAIDGDRYRNYPLFFVRKTGKVQSLRQSTCWRHLMEGLFSRL